MVIAVKNLDRLVKKYNRLGNIDMKPVMQKATQLVQRTAKDLAPVSVGLGPQARPETRARGEKMKASPGGHLQRNIFRKTYTLPNKTGVVGEVYDPVEYAVYQEFGTSKMKPQSFMRPALREHQATIEKEFENYLKQHNRRAVK